MKETTTVRITRLSAYVLFLTVLLPLVTQSSPVTFLGPQEARAAIANDSSYFLAMNLLEIKARIGQLATGETLRDSQMQCMKRYAAAALSFTDTEKMIIQEIISQFDTYVETTYPIMAAVPWSFYKLSDEVEGGIPHTDGRNIVLPAGFCDTLVAQFRSLTDDTLKMLELRAISYSLFSHEKIHVTQTAFRQSYDSLYARVWGFQKASQILRLDSLMARRVLNPDARFEGWTVSVATDNDTLLIHPMLLFTARTSEIPQMPEDFQEVGVCLQQTDGGLTVILDSCEQPRIVLLQELPGYHLKFRTVGRNPFRERDSAFQASYVGIYHPDEIVALVFDAIVVFDLLDLATRLPKKNSEFFEGHVNAVRNWFRNWLEH